MTIPIQFYQTAIQTLAPGAAYFMPLVYDYSAIIWQSPEIPQPSEAAINVQTDTLYETYLATEYLRQRAAAYPPQSDLANGLYEDSIGNPVPLANYYSSYAAVNALYPPTVLASGVLYTGRGSGAGPEDLNVSYYVEFDSASITESGTELYIPGTSTIIPYNSYPGGFDSAGNCFTEGNYQMQIRRVSTGTVLAEITVPLSPGSQNVAF